MWHDGTRGEGKGGNTPEINLAGSAFYGNPGCHGASIGKYKKGAKEERWIGLDRKRRACRGVEGVMGMMRNWGELACVPGVGMGLVWVCG